MRVWILAKNHETYENRRFSEVAHRIGVDLTLVQPDDIDLVVTQDGPNSVILGGRPVDLPDCLVPRMGAGTTSYGLAIVRHLERLGVYVPNSSESISTAKDKLATLQTLATNNVPIPKTMLARFPLNLEAIESQIPFPIVAKPASGSRGKGVFLCENRRQLADLVELIKIFHDLTVLVVFQEFIANSAGRDVRVLVIGGKPIGAMLRTAGEGQFKANFSAGGTVTRFELNPEVEHLAVESARLLKLDIAGVDILFGDTQHMVCEVNSSPGFQGFELATGIDVPRQVFDHIQSRIPDPALFGAQPWVIDVPSRVVSEAQPG